MELLEDLGVLEMMYKLHPAITSYVQDGVTMATGPCAVKLVVKVYAPTQERACLEMLVSLDVLEVLENRNHVMTRHAQCFQTGDVGLFALQLVVLV